MDDTVNFDKSKFMIKKMTRLGKGEITESIDNQKRDMENWDSNWRKGWYRGRFFFKIRREIYYKMTVCIKNYLVKKGGAYIERAYLQE